MRPIEQIRNSIISEWENVKGKLQLARPDSLKEEYYVLFGGNIVNVINDYREAVDYTVFLNNAL
jgi:hypothetical protein